MGIGHTFEWANLLTFERRLVIFDKAFFSSPNFLNHCHDVVLIFILLLFTQGEPGLRHRFTLRNIIDDQGVEIMYELYNPMIRDITVIKLEKRLDEEMVYLRDALPEYRYISRFNCYIPSRFSVIFIWKCGNCTLFHH